MKISTTFLALLIIVLPRFAWAGTTGKIAGKVVDARTGEPLVGATVEIVDTKLGAITDPNGSYFIIEIPPGTYEVKASYVGYRAVIEKGVQVYIDRTTPVDLSLWRNRQYRPTPLWSRHLSSASSTTSPQLQSKLQQFKFRSYPLRAWAIFCNYKLV